MEGFLGGLWGGPDLHRGGEEVQDAGLEDGGQQASEIQPHSAQAEAAVHAVFQNGRQGAPLPYSWQLRRECFQVKDPAYCDVA